jgi:hypothetical protein
MLQSLLHVSTVISGIAQGVADEIILTAVPHILICFWIPQLSYCTPADDMNNHGPEARTKMLLSSHKSDELRRFFEASSLSFLWAIQGLIHNTDNR